MPLAAILYDTPGLVNSTAAPVVLEPGYYQVALSQAQSYQQALLETGHYVTVVTL